MSDERLNKPVADLITNGMTAEGYLHDDVLKVLSERVKDASHKRHMDYLAESVTRSIEDGICPSYLPDNNGNITGNLSLLVGGEISQNEHTTALMSVFGTGYELALDFLLKSLMQAVDAQSQDEMIRRLNGAIALIKELDPQDPAEAMLISQMVATHRAAMSMLGKSGKAKLADTAELWSKHAHRILTLYTHQMKALQKHRHGGKQTVVVKHVHVHGGGQAIVGDVTASAGNGEG